MAVSARDQILPARGFGECEDCDNEELSLCEGLASGQSIGPSGPLPGCGGRCTERCGPGRHGGPLVKYDGGSSPPTEKCGGERHDAAVAVDWGTTTGLSTTAMKLNMWINWYTELDTIHFHVRKVLLHKARCVSF